MLSRVKINWVPPFYRLLSSSSSKSTPPNGNGNTNGLGKVTSSRDSSKQLTDSKGNILDKNNNYGLPISRPLLPDVRPWELEKPESEKLPITPHDFVSPRIMCSVTDVIDYRRVHPMMRRFRYPQFFDEENSIEYKKTLKERLIQSSKQSDYDFFPIQSDIVIIGGGIIGTSIAYFLKQKARDSVSVCVIEQDPTYSRASTTLSVGGIRQQFSLKENIEMSMFTADFLKNSKQNLSILDDSPPDISFNPQGYLFCATIKGADSLLENHALQSSMGAYVDLLNKDQLKQKFPFLNTEDIALGTYGVQNEGWFDPWSLLIAMKGKAEFQGVTFYNAEFVDFNVRSQPLSFGASDDVGNQQEEVQNLIVRFPTGEERQLQFGYAIIAAGADSGDITLKLGIGNNEGIRRIPLPVEKRKRYVFVFHCPDGPGLDFPFLIDPSGVYCRREGLGGNYVCGKCPSEADEPDCDNLDVDYGFFEREIWPILAHRVKAFEKVKIVSAWAGFYDYNYFDQNGIVGKHPYYFNLLWACGFSGHGIQMGPAIGKAVADLIVDTHYDNLDLSRLGWDRILSNYPLKETNII